MSKLTIAAMGLIALAIASGCGSEDGDASAPPDVGSNPSSPGELWDRKFKSTAVTEDGEPRPLVKGTRLTVSFERSDKRRDIGWGAGCTSFGAQLDITEDKLNVGSRVAATLIGCPDDLARQENWVTEFFTADPDWRLDGDELVLSSDGTVITFEEARR